MNNGARSKKHIQGMAAYPRRQDSRPRFVSRVSPLAAVTLLLLAVFLEKGYAQSYFSTVGVEPLAYGLDTSRFPGSDPSIRAQNCLIALGVFNPLGGVCDMTNEVGTPTGTNRSTNQINFTINPFNFPSTITTPIPVDPILQLPCATIRTRS
jgi:hypothetical protein